MFNHFKYFVAIILLSSCGLNYVAPPTMESLVVNRKKKVEDYISAEYKNVDLSYTSLFFGETTVIKPENYKILDSLYSVKYSNEKRGVYEPALDDKIGNQKQIIQNDSLKVLYIEHHVYAISDSINTEVSFADVTLDPQLNVTNFLITEQYTFPKYLIDEYTVYFKEESIINKGYLASSAERNFYSFYKNHFDALPFSEKEAFLTHTLRVLETAREIRSVDIELLLKSLGVNYTLYKNYDKNEELYSKIEGVFLDGELIAYEAELLTKTMKYELKFSPYLEIQSIQKLAK